MPYRYPPEFRVSAARSWTCWLLEGRWRLCQLILECRSRRTMQPAPPGPENRHPRLRTIPT